MGARVLLSARKADELEAACAQLRAQGMDASWIAADGAVEADIARLAQQAIERLGHIDILVNNAGATWGAPAEDHPVEAWDKVMNLNIRGVFLLTQAIGKASMIPRRYGRIVNVASIAGLLGNPPELMHTIAYNTSKGALVNFTRALAAEWGQLQHHGQRAGAGLLPLEDDEGRARAVRRRGAGALRATEAHRRRGRPEGRRTAVRLRCRQHITGQILAVDGGVSVY